MWFSTKCAKYSLKKSVMKKVESGYEFRIKKGRNACLNVVAITYLLVHDVYTSVKANISVV